MNEYTIRCTEQQTHKELELGASINFNKIGEGRPLNYFISREKKGYYKSPTAAQMIDWLETQGIHIYAHKIKAFLCHNYRTSIAVWETKNYNTLLHKDYLSSKEATLAAIDAAIDYLVNNNLIK